MESLFRPLGSLAAGEETRVPSLRHALRHTFNTHAQPHGATATSTAGRLGHSEKMAETQYQHLALYGDHLLETMRKATEGVIY